VRRADNLTIFVCRLSWNLGASTSWNSQDLPKPVMELLYLYENKCCQPNGLNGLSTPVLVAVHRGLNTIELLSSSSASLQRWAKQFSTSLCFCVKNNISLIIGLHRHWHYVDLTTELQHEICDDSETYGLHVTEHLLGLLHFSIYWPIAIIEKTVKIGTIWLKWRVKGDVHFFLINEMFASGNEKNNKKC